MSRWPPVSRIPRMPLCNLMSTFVINEHGSHVEQGAHPHSRGGVVLLNLIHDVPTQPYWETNVGLEEFCWHNLIIRCCVRCDCPNVGIFLMNMNIWVFWLTAVPPAVSCLASETYAQAPFWRAGSSLSGISPPREPNWFLWYRLTKSSFAPSHKTSL